jgi:diguanylate cyclase (GGDEF)-like protein
MAESASPGVNERRSYTASTINTAFNEFLRLQEIDRTLLARYQSALRDGSDTFARVFYDYLLGAPATAAVLQQYQARGGRLDDLTRRQLQHLLDLVAGHLDDAYARRMAHIGEIHHRYGIEPVWIMGAYLLYLNHLQRLVRTHAAIASADREPLEHALHKLLFRDMGLMLEGYWDASLTALGGERDKVSSLQQQITSLLANIPQVLWSVDVIHNAPIYVSPSAYEVCDMDISLPIPCLNWTVPEDRDTVRRAWQKALAGHRVEVESRVQRPSGEARWFRRVFYPASDNSGQVVRIDGLMEETTEQKQMIERLHRLATTDILTGLPNRALFQDRLTQAIAAAARTRDAEVVLMLMDLDRFKEINDTLGHSAGDEVLKLVAQRLHGALREADTLARLGGDEFAILLPRVADGRATAEHVAHKLLGCFSQPFRLGEQDLYLGAGLGVVVYPEHGEDVGTLLSRADVAMYGTKNRDIGYLFYDAAFDPNTQQRLQLSGELRQALASGELELFYQPKIDLRTKQPIGAEALLRWRHPTRGLLLPDHFLALAERTGLIRSLTDWVLDSALQQCCRWREAGIRLRLAVNVSARVFQDPGFPERLEQLMQAHGTGPACLEIEITENALMHDIDHVSTQLERLARVGVHIAIDDFGTGYSSLGYLKKLPLRTLKIDKSFVHDMTRDENDAVIVRSTIDLAHNLGCHVVAEGIENHETLELLTVLGCDGGQGFHLALPMNQPDLERWLHNQR